ncbi:MAG: class I SAM-dependent methyltransferase [Candidatus Geothermarchaeales archaeon]
MKNEYLTDEEYDAYFFELGGVRKKLADDLLHLALRPGMRVLDVASGHGTFACEVANLIRKGEVVGIGLRVDVEDSKSYLKEHDSYGIVKYQEMDATQMAFSDGSFDMVVNFLGLEDINMTKGREGVRGAIGEMVRVLKPGGVLEIALNVNGEEEEEVLSEEVTGYIGHNAYFYPPRFYVRELKRHSAEVLLEKWYYTGKKLTAGQARRELRYACEMTPVVYAEYRVKCRPLDQVWERFGARIGEHGLAMYSDILAIFARKA